MGQHGRFVNRRLIRVIALGGLILLLFCKNYNRWRDIEISTRVQQNQIVV